MIPIYNTTEIKENCFYSGPRDCIFFVKNSYQYGRQFLCNIILLTEYKKHDWFSGRVEINKLSKEIPLTPRYYKIIDDNNSINFWKSKLL